MSLTGADLGVLADLAKALGLLDSNDNLNGDWLNAPGDRVKQILADDTQRAGLVSFVDEALAGTERVTDPAGLVWLPVLERVEAGEPHMRVYVVLDEHPEDHVRIGVGVAVSASDDMASAKAHVPLFRAAKLGHAAAADPVVLGTSDGVVSVDVDITIGDPTIQSVSLTASVPTDGTTPTFGLALRGLRLPGAPTPTDLNLSLADLADLEASFMQLVLGLAKAQADALGNGALASLAGLVGLRAGSAVPQLPVEDVLHRGLAAVTEWFEGVISGDATRAVWLTELASLLGGTSDTDAVSFTLGPARLRVGARAGAGTGGHPTVTPFVAVELGPENGETLARANADLAVIDLGSGSAHALPSCSVVVIAGERDGGGGNALLTGDPAVDRFVAGFALDGDRKPTLRLAAEGVTIGGHVHPVLDLSSPEAIAQSGGTLVGDVVDELLQKLGPVGTAAEMLLGLDAPAGVQKLDLAQFLQNPLGAVGSYWHGLLTQHAAAVPDVLVVLRDLVSDAGKAAIAPSGTGTETDPWRVPIVDSLELEASLDGDVLTVAVGTRLVIDDLGLRCTRLEWQFAVGIVAVDLAGSHAVFLPRVTTSLGARARGSTAAEVELGGFAFRADQVGLDADWRPGQGLTVGVLAPNLAVHLPSGDFPVTLPAVGADGSVTLDDAGWDALEGLLGALAAAAPLGLVGDLAEILCWRLPPAGGSADGPHLRLAELQANPAKAIEDWLAGVAFDAGGELLGLLRPLARAFAGSAGDWGLLDGVGTPEDPWRIGLEAGADRPSLVAWVEPEGSAPLSALMLDEIEGWHMGAAPLTSELLAQAVAAQGVADPLLRALVRGRNNLAAGFDALVDRWNGSDGRVIPPPSDPAGVTVHRFEGIAHDGLANELDLDALLGRTPTTVVRVSVGPTAWTAAAPAERIVHLDTPGLPPEAFTRPSPASGKWFVVLAGRADAKLATGDPDGVGGQAARLERVLAALASVDPTVAVVATAEAGHAAVRAADATAGVTDVVTLGSPWSPLTLSVIDVAPAAEAVRLLAALQPADPGDEEGTDLALGRSLLGALVAGFPLDDPTRELQQPAASSGPLRAGLNVHAVFGVVAEERVRAALTAVVVDGLRRRGEAFATTDFGEPESVRAGARLPLSVPASSGLGIGGHVTVELAGVERGAGDSVSVAADRAMHVHLELFRTDGWLVGGPDPARVPGSQHDIDLRWLEVDATVPVHGPTDRATGRLVLYEPRVFGLARPRWVVRTTGSALAEDEATPALPEVRVLLSALCEALISAGAGDPAVAAAIATLKAVGVMDAAGGSVPDALDHFLHDPVAFSATVLGDAGRRASLAGGLGSLIQGATVAADRVSWTAGAATITLDLAARHADVEMTGAGAVPWQVQARLGAGRPDVQLVLGAAGSTPAGGGRVTLTTMPALGVTGEWDRPGAAPETVALWPSPDAGGIARLAVRLAPAELARVSLEYLRRLDESVQPLVDAVLNAFGLLAATQAGDGVRPVRLPVGLVTDPLGWLSHAGALGAPGGGLDAAKTAALLDALKPVLGVAGDPGVWDLATGLKVRADASGGNLRLGVQLDTSELAPIQPIDQRLNATILATLVLPHGRVPQPGLELGLGLPGAASGRLAVEVTPDGVQVFLRPNSGADISLYPNPPGLGALASAAEHALSFVLNALAAETGNDTKGRAGAIVREVGDALGLRTGGTFHDEDLKAWAADPAGSLAARLPALSVATINALSTALDPALPGGLVAGISGSELQVTFGSLVVGLNTNPFAVRFLVAPVNVPGIDRARVEAQADGSGLTLLDVEVGPVIIDAGGATLRPYVRVRAGSSPPGGRRAELGLGLDDTGTKSVAARWLLGGSFGLVALDGATEHSEPEAVALAVVDAVVDLAGGHVIATDAVRDLLARACGAATIGDVLEGVLVHKQGSDWQPVAGLFDVERVLGRLQQLGLNLVRVAQPKLDLAELSLALVESPANVLGVELIPKSRYPLGGDDVTVSLEFDASWIEKEPVPAPRLLLRVLHVGGAPGSFAFEPGVEVDGVGIRIERASGPLLDVDGVTLASVALHVYGEVGLGTGIGGGVQLQLSDLAVGTAGAGGGNQIAQGVMKDAGSGQTKLAPKFSPAVAVQKQPAQEVLVTLTAGEPPGPWWLAIQKGFGPVYIEQIGFDAKVEQRHLKSISILLDGRVSIFGLTAAVDDLSLTFVVASNASVFDPDRWAVDLAGFAISSDLGGITLVGGLRKFAEPGPPGQPDTVQYIGMLLARFGTYGLTVFGGYGLGRDAGGATFASFFAFGAVNGPIGGPPAFFLTGIGGGLGINRDLIFPQDLGHFGTFPFIQALDPGATPPSDPMAVLQQYKDTFPIEQGEFWFAAGISFNSFALVDGVAVVAITVGDGFELALLGLARMALPRPQFALASIELGLICRFSSREGVLWIQAQLTDNSWLLFPEIRLTGGFAFVSWFKGPNRGQFVLTLGGYHPSFHRDGYPVVPRLGFVVELDVITIKGENYFALTSEALMAGGRLEGSADLGPAWAHIVFGCDGIIFFDPFFLDVRVYASISAGITIDVWIGTITISISIGAEIHVLGPQFYGEVTFDVGPVSLTVSFGDSSQEPHYIDYPTFVRKYLEEGAGGAARALSSITGRGTLTPKAGATAKDTATADGSSAKPFVVISEFELSVTTTMPIVEVRADGVDAGRVNPSQALGVAPMGKPKIEPALRLRLRRDVDGVDHLPLLLNEPNRPRIIVELRATGAFPVAVWGLPQNKDAKKVPSGDVITAVEGVRLDFHALIEPGLPEVRYDQVETDKRRPLPFVRPPVRTQLMQDAAALEALVPSENVFELARKVLPRAGNTATAVAALPLDRAAPPRIGSLTEGLATEGLALGDAPPPQSVQPPSVDDRVLPPNATALLTAPVTQPERLVKATSVSDAPGALRRTAPTLLAVQAATDVSIPSLLHRVPAPALAINGTVIPNGTVPLTRSGYAPAAAVAGRGALLDGQQRLTALTKSLGGGVRNQIRREASAAGGALTPGEIVVLTLPNAVRDVSQRPRPTLTVNGAARVVVLAHGGTVLADELRPEAVVIPSGSERIAVLALGDDEEDTAGGLLSGWQAGQRLAALGWNAALGSRCLVTTEGVTLAPRRQRREAGWVTGAELVRGTTTVATRFLGRPRAIAVVLDQPVGTEAGIGLAMTLDGATRMTGHDGAPLSPTVVATGTRSAVIYTIEPSEGPVTVTVASEDGWHLVGVVGGDSSVAVADTLVERGLDGAVRPLAAGGGRVWLAWVEPAPPPTPPPHPPVGPPPVVRPPGRKLPAGMKHAARKKTTRSRKGN